jgi:hypothetical protein
VKHYCGYFGVASEQTFCLVFVLEGYLVARTQERLVHLGLDTDGVAENN